MVCKVTKTFGFKKTLNKKNELHNLGLYSSFVWKVLFYEFCALKAFSFSVNLGRISKASPTIP